MLITGHGGYWSSNRAAPLVVDSATGPLRFHQFSPQQVTSELCSSRTVSIFDTRFEGSAPMLRVSGCDQFPLLGHGGNGKGMPGKPLFEVERTTNWLLADGVEKRRNAASRSTGCSWKPGPG